MLAMCLVALSFTLPSDKQFSSSYASVYMKGANHRVQNCMRLASLAKEMNAPVMLVLAIASKESGFKSKQISSAGARGLLGVMPSNMKGRDKTKPLAFERRGIEILKYLLDTESTLCGALAYYNAGTRGSCSGIGGGYAEDVMDRHSKLCALYDHEECYTC